MTSSVLEQLLTHFNLSAEDWDVFIKTAPYRYKSYEIPKRNGGVRKIAQPTKALKTVQRWLLSRILKSLPIHEVATAYRKNKSIKDHAIVHASNKFLLKLDFKDFFPSLNMNDFELHCDKYLTHLTKEDIAYLVRLLFWAPTREDGKLVLSIGAPSSPAISNSLLFDFDSQVNSLCQECGVTYTRYADDMALSCNSPDILAKVELKIIQICKLIDYPSSLKLNSKKTVNVSKKERRFLTGLVLSNEGTVSLGRDKKRFIRAQAHNFSKNFSLYDELSRNKIKGMLLFCFSIDKAFVLSIEKMMIRQNPQSYMYLMK